MNPPVVVLGPQHPQPNLSAVLDKSGVGDGPVALITAGWRHDESDTGPLEAAVARPCRHLPLYAWFEEAMRAQPDIARAYRARQAQVRAFRELYRIRVDASLIAVHRLLERFERDPELVAPELLRAVQAVRRVDEDLLAELSAIAEEHADVRRPWTRPEVAPFLQRAEELLDGVTAIAVAGGHVAVLRNRLRFFGLDEVLRAAEIPVVCWSGGAMVLTERVVLFYDDPPEGAGEAEVLGRGLDLLPEVVLFPHAMRRLRLGDTNRLATLAMRFAPATCLTLENGAHVGRANGGWINRGTPGTACAIQPDGTLEPLP